MPANWTGEEVFLIGCRARELALQGRYEDAAIIFDGLAAVAPENSWVRESLAALCLRIDRPSTALDVLDSVQGSARAGQLRVEAMLALGRSGDAVGEFIRIRSGLSPAADLQLELRLAQNG